MEGLKLFLFLMPSITGIPVYRSLEFIVKIIASEIKVKCPTHRHTNFMIYTVYYTDIFSENMVDKVQIRVEVMVSDQLKMKDVGRAVIVVLHSHL